jgi:thiol-disulfide isomerase/thioredoxin
MRPLNTRTIHACFVALLTAVASPAPALCAGAPDVSAVLAAPAVAAGGSTVPLTVTMTIGPGWHVNSHLPSEAYLIPTGVKLSSSAGALSPVRYPGDVVRRLAFGEKPLRLYEGAVQFAVDLVLPAAAGGSVSIFGRVTYQACNDRQCFPPASIELAASVRIGSGAEGETASSSAAESAPPLRSELARASPARQALPPGAPVIQGLALFNLDGASFSLDSLKGDVVVLDVWASWCVPCRASFPFFNGLQARYGENGVRVVGLTLEEDTAAVLSFLEAVPARFPIVRDPSGRAGEALGVVAMPTTFLIDREGRIVARFEGGDRHAHEGLEAAVSAVASGAGLPGGLDVRVAAGRKATGRVQAWRRGYLADPIMNLDGDPLTRLLREHVHSSKEGAAGDGGAVGGGCGCN